MSSLLTRAKKIERERIIKGTEVIFIIETSDKPVEIIEDERIIQVILHL